MRSATLSVQNLQVRYGDARAVDDVTFEIGPGRCLAMLGANAAGKSSIAKAVTGIVRPVGGVVSVNGEDLVGRAPHRLARSGVGYLPEGRGIFPSLTVEENVRLGLRPVATSRRAAAKERLYSQFPALSSRRDQVAGTLSGGEQQMLAMGRALATDPRLLVIDELSLGLAPLVIDRIYETLHTVRNDGVTILLIEQYVDRALHFADHAVLLRRGTIVWRGTAVEGQARLADGYLSAEPDTG